VTRLIDMGIEPFLLSSSLIGVLAQRLVRRLCPDCKTATAPTAAQRAELPPQMHDRRVYQAVGCPACKGIGYRGRTGIYELITVDRDCARLVHEGAPEQVIRDHAARRGTASLRDDGMRWVAAGETTLDEVLRVTRTSGEG